MGKDTTREPTLASGVCAIAGSYLLVREDASKYTKPASKSARWWQIESIGSNRAIVKANVISLPEYEFA
jgi:hypothetical protein